MLLVAVISRFPDWNMISLVQLRMWWHTIAKLVNLQLFSRNIIFFTGKMSADLQWMILRNNSCFLLRNQGTTFTKVS